MKLNIKKVKIGSSRYDVEYVYDLKKNDEDLSGRIFAANRLIKISSDSSYQNQLQTLIHESLHGICWEYAVKDIEDIVEPISNGIYALIIDNPKFIQKILDYTKKLK
jgi:hypothetical protein